MKHGRITVKIVLCFCTVKGCEKGACTFTTSQCEPHCLGRTLDLLQEFLSSLLRKERQEVSQTSPKAARFKRASYNKKVFPLIPCYPKARRFQDLVVPPALLWCFLPEPISLPTPAAARSSLKGKLYALVTSSDALVTSSELAMFQKAPSSLQTLSEWRLVGILET